MSGQVKNSSKCYLGGVVVLHLLGIVLLAVSMNDHPAMMGLGFLAYTLGLRHAFDVDHIAAIDNTVRKLLQQKEDPLGVGFFFSLGHSTVVCMMAIVAAFAAIWAKSNLPEFQRIGGLIGTSVSGVFLVLIGVINLVIMHNIYQVFIEMRQQSSSDHEQKLDDLLNSRGFIARFITPLFKFVNKSWHVYPIGFLFGLGFDTASEVALLAISAGVAGNTSHLSGLFALPILFAAGMSLFDTADGIFMVRAYKWAFRTPLRKIYYNMSVTGLSVAAALVIGSIELAQIIGPKLGLSGSFWSWVQGIDFSSLGYILVGLFFFTWLLSYSIWHFMKIEQRWQAVE